MQTSGTGTITLTGGRYQQQRHQLRRISGSKDRRRQHHQHRQRGDQYHRRFRLRRQQYGIGTDANSDSIGDASGYSGNITLQADSVSFGTGTSIKTSGNIAIEPYTASPAWHRGERTWTQCSTYLGYLKRRQTDDWQCQRHGDADGRAPMRRGTRRWRAHQEHGQHRRHRATRRPPAAARSPSPAGR